MQQITIRDNEAGQRFDKFLQKYFKEAGVGFLYKMLRKKNIILNGKKAYGNEQLNIGDTVTIYMGDDTIEKFRGTQLKETPKEIPLSIVYEDEHTLIINKPSGMLSQKAKITDISANEYIISYLLHQRKITLEELATFKPAICNRLDRNTSGLLVAGKTLKGIQTLSEMFRNREIDKYYLAIVQGNVINKVHMEGFLKKDNANNTVHITQENNGGEHIITEYEPVHNYTNISEIRVKLITGKTHQIRAHLASVGHPIIGDYKYGERSINHFYQQQYGVAGQLLHAWKIQFPAMPEEFAGLHHKTLIAEPPSVFKQVLDGSD